MRHDNAVTPQLRFYREGDMVNLNRDSDRMPAIHAVLMQHGNFVRTFEANGKPIAVVGMHVRWAGVADVWAVVSDDVRGHGLRFTREVIQLWTSFADELELWRVGFMVHADQLENRRWARVLGFEIESLEEQAAPDGGDLLHYRWLRWPERQQKN